LIAASSITLRFYKLRVTGGISPTAKIRFGKLSTGPN
jgi:hypothetical protein